MIDHIYSLVCFVCAQKPSAMQGPSAMRLLFTLNGGARSGARCLRPAVEQKVVCWVRSRAVKAQSYPPGWLEDLLPTLLMTSGALVEPNLIG